MVLLLARAAAVSTSVVVLLLELARVGERAGELERLVGLAGGDERGEHVDARLAALPAEVRLRLSEQLGRG